MEHGDLNSQNGNPTVWENRRALTIDRLRNMEASDVEIAQIATRLANDGIGVSRMTVWRIRTGEVTYPRQRTMRLIEAALDWFDAHIASMREQVDSERLSQ
jgi:hypothetical protein